MFRYQAGEKGWRIEAAGPAERAALDAAQSGEGTRIMAGKIGDPLYPESRWAKMEYVARAPNGRNIRIHYWQNLETGELHGFKFKSRPVD